MREGWTYKKLGEVCDVVTGSTPKTNVDSYWNGSYYWVTPAELKGDLYVCSTERTITEEAIKHTNLTLMPAGTVLLSSRAPIGKVAITTVPMYCNQGFKNLICKEDILNKYLYWFLWGKTEYLNSLGRGATFKEISKSIVENIQIPLPPKSQQEAIVSELDEINSLLALKREQLQKYDKLAQSLFYEMFGDPVENEKGWEVKKLGEVCDVQNGFAFKSELFVTSGLPIARISNIQNNELTTDCVYFNEESYSSNLDRYKVAPGRILIAMSGATTGKCGINKTNVTFYLNQRVGMFIEDENLVNKLYLFSYLLTKTDESLSIAMGVAQPNLSTSQIKNYEIPLPPLTLQKQFASRIEQIEEQKKQVQAAIEKLETLLASRMQYWFE